MFKFREKLIRLGNIILLIIGFISLVVQLVLREMTKQPGMSPIYAWIDPAITCLILMCTAMFLKSTGIIKNKAIKTTVAILITGVFLIKAMTIPFKKANYIHLESPTQKYTIFIENSHIGFDTGISRIYTKENFLFKNYIGGIQREKRGAAIGADLEEFHWINDSIAIVEFYDYKNIHKVFTIDFQDQSIVEAQ